MASFKIQSYDEETKTALVQLNESEEETPITFDDPEAADPTKMMAIFKAYAGDGNLVPLTSPVETLPIGETVDCDTLI